MSRNIVSKKRVADHGEVFTSRREVNAMLDLVQQETQRIDSRFLEPACGNGDSWPRSWIASSPSWTGAIGAASSSTSDTR